MACHQLFTTIDSVLVRVWGKIPYSSSRVEFLSSLINTTVLARRAGPLIEKGEEGAESLKGKQIPPDDAHCVYLPSRFMYH